MGGGVMGCQLGDATTPARSATWGGGRQACGLACFFRPLGRNPKKLRARGDDGGRARGARRAREPPARRARRPGAIARTRRARGRAVARSSGRAVARVRRPRAAPKRSIARRVLSPLWCTATYPGSTRTSADGLSASAPARLATLPGSTPRALEAVRADERLASPRRSSRRASSNSAARGRSRRRNRERSASACFSSRALFPRRAPSGGGDFAVTSERRSPSSLSARRMIETASARSEQSALSFHRANEGPLDRTRVESRRSNHLSQRSANSNIYYCRGYSATPLYDAFFHPSTLGSAGRFPSLASLAPLVRPGASTPRPARASAPGKPQPLAARSRLPRRSSTNVPASDERSYKTRSPPKPSSPSADDASSR